jgi:hypothetical protein
MSMMMMMMMMMMVMIIAFTVGTALPREGDT